MGRRVCGCRESTLVRAVCEFSVPALDIVSRLSIYVEISNFRSISCGTRFALRPLASPLCHESTERNVSTINNRKPNHIVFYSFVYRYRIDFVKTVESEAGLQDCNMTGY